MTDDPMTDHRVQLARLGLPPLADDDPELPDADLFYGRTPEVEHFEDVLP